MVSKVAVFRTILLLALPAAMALGPVGCSPSAAWSERREEQDPLIRRARSLKGANDMDGAIALYNRALDRRPGLGRAHLELALIYDGAKKDYVRAIYHYEKYLDIYPKADKAEDVKECIRWAKMHYAASLPDRPSEAIAEIAQLRQENDALREHLAEYKKRLEKEQKKGEREAAGTLPAAAAAERTPAPPSRTDLARAPAPAPVVQPGSVARPAPPPPAFDVPPPAPASAAVETYRVQRGDNLSSIAAENYNDPGQWSRIFEANRGTLNSPESLRVGQTLMIPR